MFGMEEMPIISANIRTAGDGQVGEDVGKYDRDIKSWPKYKESRFFIIF